MSGPTPTGERALAPDLARGVMLLLIALANSHFFLAGDVMFGGFPLDGGAADRAVGWVIATFVDGRAFPLFGLLFGYGAARIVARQTAARRVTRRLLWRRSAILVAVGLVDGMLIFAGDILVAYGVLLAVGAWAIGWRDRTLLIVAALLLLLHALPSDDALSTAIEPPDAAMLPPDPGTQLSERVGTVLFVGLLGPVGFACPYLVGLWAGRRRILEQPERPRRLLIAVAIGGLAIAVLGAQPAALVVAGAVDVPGEAARSWIGPLHDATGVVGGFGYAALLALVSVRLAPRQGRVARALAATGARSMTCYLCQSPVWFVVFTPYLLDGSRTLGVATTALLATATWAGTVVLADRLRAAGRRGPFERLTRRVTYGR